jgi:hypothetical protein
MRKDIIGNWGSKLGDGDYACALAINQVLQFTNDGRSHWKRCRELRR